MAKEWAKPGKMFPSLGRCLHQAWGLTPTRYSSFVASKTTHCNTTPGTALDIYCKSSNWTNFNEEDSIIKRYPNKLQIINKKANAFLFDAFDNISSSSIETLQLDLADGRSYIDSSCFLKLQNLKRLEINSASVLLNPYSFYGLKNLTYLKIKLDNETARHMDKILYQQLNLNKLELLNHHDSDICYSTRKNTTINLLQLQYTGGFFKTLPHNSFVCFGNLQSITITESDLMFLEPGAFNGLKKLETVSLTSNHKLTHISSNVFNIGSLEIINLSNNSISTIDNEALTIENNKLLLVNLSYNSLEIIEEGMFRKFKCHFIDLSQSGIIGIVNGAFNTSRINIIDLMKNQILRFNSFKWGINYTITLALLDIIKFDIATSSSFNDSQISRVTNKLNSIIKESSLCYLTEYGIYKICKTRNKSIRLVKDISNFLSIPKLEIRDNEILSIDNYAFKNLTILTLKISSAVEKFTITNNSFAGLPNLKVLEIDTKQIFLKTPVFYHLQSLIALEIPLIEPQEFQCRSFSNLQSLEELVLVNYNTVDICYGLCRTINFGIKSLQYKNSIFTELQWMKLSCLKKLVHLAITNAWNVSESNTQTDCFNEEPFTICKKFNTLTSVNLITNRYGYINYRLGIKVSAALESQTLKLSGQIYSIGRNAFQNSDIVTNLKTLICHQTTHVFTIYPESFEGLTELENLELNTGPIVLKAHLFDKLPSLKYLKIEVEETLQPLSQVLINLKNLKTLEVVGNHTIGICQNIYSHKIPHSLTDIRYTNGNITNLQANSMRCMPQLEKLIITNTQLMTIQAEKVPLMVLNALIYICLPMK
ncbi:uncharacterized protein LOC122850543 [Aphidius gifuensis]|uniref:uncharacterized protein LOC122850543 n=1 Tax=Aphidius gifuensis TaxID=684658 RepID=UPI001CDC27C6|nr:uncharacterized protein LOC122850543 [Aphidius gifuensis]